MFTGKLRLCIWAFLMLLMLTGVGAVFAIFILFFIVAPIVFFIAILG